VGDIETMIAVQRYLIVRSDILLWCMKRHVLNRPSVTYIFRRHLSLSKTCYMFRLFIKPLSDTGMQI